MPTPTEILGGLTRIANAGFGVAVAWHALIGVVLVALISGSRPPARALAALAITMLASVSTVALLSGNPFNAVAFAVLALVLLMVAVDAPRDVVGGSTRVSSALGGLLVAFAWCYPHFLQGRPALAYMIAAPLGLVPCPTLALLVGLALAGYRPAARSWSFVLGAAGLFYGAFGVYRLGVKIDVVLLVGALVLIMQALRAGARSSVGAAPDRNELSVPVSSRRSHDPRARTLPS
jgi:hypothetical protein